MRDFRDSKAMARALRRGLETQNIKITHSQSLELMAQAFGCENWNVLAAKIEASRPRGQTAQDLHCSFCSKSQQVVEALIAGPDVAICNECVRLCDDIVDDQTMMTRLAEATSTEAVLDVSDRETLARFLVRAKERLEREEGLLRAFDHPQTLPSYHRAVGDAERERRRARLRKTVLQLRSSIELVEAALRTRPWALRFRNPRGGPRWPSSSPP